MTLHIEHEEEDECSFYGISSNVYRRFCDTENPSFSVQRVMNYLTETGQNYKYSKKILKDFHGFVCNGMMSMCSIAEARFKLIDFVNCVREITNCENVCYVVFNGYTLAALKRLILDKSSDLFVSLNSIVPLNRKSHFFGFRRCVFHIRWCDQKLLKNEDFNVCSRSEILECLINNYDLLFKQLSLFFHRLKEMYYPKEETNVIVYYLDDFFNINIDMDFLIFQNILDTVALDKSVEINVKRDL